MDAFSHSCSSSKTALGEFKCSMAAAKGFRERSIPITLVQSAKASMIDWIAEEEDVDCPVDDMRKMFVQVLAFRGNVQK